MSEKTKKNLNKFFRAFLILIGASCVINLLIILGVYINHNNKLSAEEGYITLAPGKMVEVDGRKMHVYYEENESSEVTLMFIHNTGATDDAITLQPLFAKLNDSYSIAYVDRCGNGYSEDADYEGTLENQLFETREALAAAGVSGPYVLVASGNASFLQYYWVSEYPDEVVGIIDIGTTYPEEYDGVTQEQYCGVFKWIMQKGSTIGAQRFSTSVYPSNLHAVYTEKQMNIRKALISKNYYTKGIYNEDYEMVNNAAIAKQCGFPENVPALVLVSNILLEPYASDDSYVQSELEAAKEEYPDFDYTTAYSEAKLAYYSKYSNVELHEMSGPAEIYSYDVDGVAEYISNFVEKIQ